LLDRTLTQARQGGKGPKEEGRGFVASPDEKTARPDFAPPPPLPDAP